MTTVIAKNEDAWALKKIQSLVSLEAAIIKKQIDKVQTKIAGFENRYGKLDRNSLYGRVDDMALVEWEGEIDTMALLRRKLTHLEQIDFKYE